MLTATGAGGTWGRLLLPFSQRLFLSKPQPLPHPQLSGRFSSVPFDSKLTEGQQKRKTPFLSPQSFASQLLGGRRQWFDSFGSLSSSRGCVGSSSVLRSLHTSSFCWNDNSKNLFDTNLKVEEKGTFEEETNSLQPTLNSPSYPSSSSSSLDEMSEAEIRDDEIKSIIDDALKSSLSDLESKSVAMGEQKQEEDLPEWSPMPFASRSLPELSESHEPIGENDEVVIRSSSDTGDGFYPLGVGKGSDRPKLANITYNQPLWQVVQYGSMTPQQFFQNDQSFTPKACNLLIRCQAEKGNLELVQETLKYMKEREMEPNLYHYTSAIAACDRSYSPKVALQLLQEMEEKEISPNQWTYCSAIRACFRGGLFQRGLELFNEARENVGLDRVIYTTLIMALIRQGDLIRPWEIFQYMTTYAGLEPDQVTYCVMIVACAKAGRVERALSIFHDMESSPLFFLQRKNGGLYPTDKVYEALLLACAHRSDCYEDAFEIYNGMIGAGIKPTVKTHQLVLRAAFRAADVKGAEFLVRQMNRSRMPVSPLTLSFLLGTYARSMRYDLTSEKNENLKKAEDLFKLIQSRKDYKPTLLTSTPFFNTLAEAGRLNRARECFNQMSQEGLEVGVYQYTTLIKMYARNKRPGYAIQIFDQMKEKGVVPDAICYEKIIRCCGLSGYIKQGIQYLEEMCEKIEEPPRNYAVRPLISATKAFPHHWDEIKAVLRKSKRLSNNKELVSLYFPREQMKRKKEHPLVTRKNMRLRQSKKSEPRKSKKRFEVKEIIISN